MGMTFQEAVDWVEETKGVAFAIKPRVRDGSEVGADSYVVYWFEDLDPEEEDFVGLHVYGGFYRSGETEGDPLPLEETPEEAKQLQYDVFGGTYDDLPFGYVNEVFVAVLRGAPLKTALADL